MANFEDEARDLREKNSELVQEVQFWKVTAAQKEKEKLELMKDINELRLKLTRLRSGGAAQASKLDAGLQIASEEALSHLVQASGAVTRTIELAKQYMRDREELDNKSPRWSNIGGTPSTDKVHRVPPLMMGGQPIQPVVSLTRTMLNFSTRARSPNNNVAERAVPMRLLQDVYIPLTRIDMADMQVNNMATEVDNTTEDLGLDDSSEQTLEESQNLSEEFETSSRRLDAVIEDLDEDQIVTPPRSRIENPLEGPSWLLDAPTQNPSPPLVRVNLEPDSTTPCEDVAAVSPAADRTHHRLHIKTENDPLPVALAFTPTVRRRKRSPTPPPAPPSPWGSPLLPTAAPAPTNSYNDNRVLKVLVAKMRMSNTSGGGDASPPKRAALATSPPKRAALATSPPQGAALATSPPKRASLGIPAPNSSTVNATPQRRSTTDAWPSPERPLRPPHSPRRAAPTTRSVSFDAPSPNGATVAGVIVSLQDTSGEPAARCASRASSRASSRDTDSDGSAALLPVETRSRRTRKAVTYKEKPLNRKLRR